MANDVVTDGKIGISLTTTYASISSTSTVFFPAAPGATVHTSNNGRYMFVRAQSDINAFDAVIISTYEDSAAASPIPRAVSMTTTNAAALGYAPVGFAQVAISSSNYGWVCMNGMPKVNLANGTNPKLPLYTTATAGFLSNTTVSAGYVQGIVASTSAVGATAVLCLASYPHLMTSNPV